MNKIIDIIMDQINWKELSMLGFLFVKMNDNTLRLHKNKKSLDIIYDYGMDLYNVEKHTNTVKDHVLECKTEKLNRVYCDQLQEIISRFFNFEYVLEGIQ